jgi:hypothetical protein
MSCSCDYDMPEFYTARIHTARKQHKCSECGCKINPGERYENVFGGWCGEVDNPKTCCRCLDLREYVKAHVPCFCFAHHNVHEDAMETAREWSHEAAGLLFGAYRRMIAINRERQVQYRARFATTEPSGGEG